MMTRQNKRKKISKFFIIQNDEKLTKLYFKSDIILLKSVFQKYMQVQINEFDTNPLYCVKLQALKLQCGMNYDGLFLQKLQAKELVSI